MSILVEDPTGNVELVYAGNQSSQNLVKEIRFYPNGDTLSVTPMKKGAVDGVVTFYYPENKPKEQTTFVSGISHGQFTRCDENGVLVVEGMLKNGEKNGVWTTCMMKFKNRKSELILIINLMENGPIGTLMES